MHRFFNEELNEWDEIVSIEFVGFEDTIDINVSDDRLFYANDILTHNCAVDEVEFDHSHISGGLSKIQTADNVFGIFTSRAMRERGRYQIQLMKTRSSSGVGMKIDLGYDIDTLRITDIDEDTYGTTAPTAGNALLNSIKNRSTTDPQDGKPVAKVNAGIQSTALRDLINNLDTDDF